MSDDVVRAAGAVVWRAGAGDLELLLVHRPEYDDWSFPKGKNRPGEADEDCAVREVEEETGLDVALEAELPSTSYVSKGGPKLVRYWLATPREPASAGAQNEVDDLEWLRPAEAAERLSYERDRDVLEAAVALLAGV